MAKKRKSTSKRKAPWRRKNPRKAAGKRATHLSASDKATAKRRAKRAGRPYPNLVDNMRVAAAKKKRKTKTRKAATRKKRKTATR